MTYSPGSAGYPPAQPPGSYGAPAPSYAQAAEPGPSKLPRYLGAAVVVLGLLAYLFSFGPMFTFNVDIGPFGTELSGTGGFGTQVAVIAALLAALLAGVSLLPRAVTYAAVVAVLAVLGALLAIYQVLVKPQGVSIGWALWVVLAFAVLQGIVAVGALLLEAGIITAPAPRPKYEQQPQYGQYGPPGGYYGQPQGQPQHTPQHAGPPQGQRPGYPSPYGGYPQGPSTGGFGSSSAPTGNFGAQNGPPTPPTGYPSFSPPPAVGAGQQQAPNPGSGQHQPQTPAPSPGTPSS